MRNLFITGTDTDAGKTFVTAGIVRAFRNAGIDAIPLKPVQTGCVNDVSSDLEFSLNRSGWSADLSEKKRLCPVRFSHECSPHLAAELSDSSINVNELAGKLQELSRNHECIVAEGAGGVLVPLGSGKTMLDLMISLGWPVVLVAANRLGAINHTLMSINTIRNAGLALAGVVMNQISEPSPLYSRNNIATIREYGKTCILGEIPFSPDRFPFEFFTGICRKLMESLKE